MPLLLRGGQFVAMRSTALASRGASRGERRKVLVITGPTGVGKSSVAISLAKRLGGEIISADSVQVYKGLDVGSAKTPVNDRENIPHHLIDIIHPKEEYSVADFFKDAREATDLVLSKGRVPIVVGGASLYLLWYMHGRPNTPKATEEQAATVNAEIARIGADWDAAIKHLADAGDPETAQSLARNDWYRLRRALEILKISGQPRTSFSLPWIIAKQPLTSQETSEAASISQNSKPEQLDYDFTCYFLYKRRTDLYRCLDLRCEQMLAGLFQEASWLLDLGILPNSSSPSRAIGYRQTMEYLAACRMAGGMSSPQQFMTFLTGFQTASRNYAKRQLTWFRDKDSFRWINASLPVGEIVDFLDSEFCKKSTVSAPSSWETMEKATRASELKALKSYVAQNKLFAKDADCAHILEWVKMTQSGYASQ